MTPKHTLTFSWEDEYLDVEVQCPWRPDDPDRPCRMFEDYEDENPSKPIDGCGAKDSLDNGGVESVGVRGRIVSSPTPVEMVWTGDSYPELSPVEDEK